MEDKSKHQFQRKTIIVKRSLQYRYMFIIAFTSFVAFMLVALDMIWNVYKVAWKHPTILSLLDEIFSNVPLTLFKLIVYIAILIIASAVVSHRIAGPLYKFEMVCGKISEGNLTERVFLRKGDALVELQMAFNRMMDKVHLYAKACEDLKSSAIKNGVLLDDVKRFDEKVKEIFPEFKI